MRTTVSLMLLAMLFNACSPGQNAASNSTPDRLPNIVILFADDLGYGDLSSYGHPYIRTPELDFLAQHGQRWTDFYVAAPVCSPSRAALLTGRLPVRTGLYGQNIGVFFPDEPGGFPDSELSLAEALKERGYVSGIFGKWHLGDAPHAWPTQHGFDAWLGVPYSNDMDWAGDPDFDAMRALGLGSAADQAERSQILATRPGKYANPLPEYFNTPLISSVAGGDSQVEQPTDQATLTRRYTEAAIEFMENNVDSPFLVYLPYTMPHTPLFRSTEFEGHSLFGRYGDVIEEIDWSVGEIRRALENLDVADNTLIVFTSDNGPWLTMYEEGGSAGLLRMGKGSTFEGGMRVPAYFYWPGRIQPGIVSEIGSTLDLFATTMNLAGLDNVTGIDGFDLSETLFDGAQSPRNEMPYYRRGVLYAYRVGQWKLHYLLEGAYGQPPERTILATPELYNLRRDPSEKFNVAAQNPDVVAEIEAAVARHREGLEIAPPAFDARLAIRGIQ
ncbi:MAG: sulfatase [Proteobacteria bacterium]|nr:sulfatase [Pseudomonadota bacterium]MDA0929402.1 sulfatase [Pseudomonadota bacterium]